MERLLRKELDPEFFEVFSCGFLEKEGRISPEDYLHQVRCAGVELADHQSRALTQDRLDWADLVLLMDLHNWKSLRKFDPVALNKVVWLGAWRSDGQWEIPDPYGKSPKEMEQIVKVMREATHSLAKEIRSFRGFNLPQMPI